MYKWVPCMSGCVWGAMGACVFLDLSLSTPKWEKEGPFFCFTSPDTQGSNRLFHWLETPPPRPLLTHTYQLMLRKGRGEWGEWGGRLSTFCSFRNTLVTMYIHLTWYVHIPMAKQNIYIRILILCSLFRE